MTILDYTCLSIPHPKVDFYMQGKVYFRDIIFSLLSLPNVRKFICLNFNFWRCIGHWEFENLNFLIVKCIENFMTERRNIIDALKISGKILYVYDCLIKSVLIFHLGSKTWNFEKSIWNFQNDGFGPWYADNFSGQVLFPLDKGFENGITASGRGYGVKP